MTDQPPYGCCVICGRPTEGERRVVIDQKNGKIYCLGCYPFEGKNASRKEEIEKSVVSPALPRL